MNEILNISNVHGYMDKQTGTAYLNAEDVARGFGFTESKGGVEYVRWRGDGLQHAHTALYGNGAL